MATANEHKRAERFDFGLDRHTGVVTCSRVKEGAPILFVSHDSEGDWQFLCGGPHAGVEGADKGLVVCLECVVADDPSLNDLADLCCNWSASRERCGAAWQRHDDFEDAIITTVEEHGWFVAGVVAGESDDEPAFAYTIGLYKTYGHAELICVGLGVEVMHVMLNRCGDLVKAGHKAPVGVAFDGILDDYKVQLREVKERESYEQHLGYAIWFNRGREFPVLQLVWPDKEGRFPGALGTSPELARQQPMLP